MNDRRFETRTPMVGANQDLMMNVAIGTVLLVGLTAGLCWVGAQVAALVFGSGSLDADLTDAATALAHLPGNVSSPSEAWPGTTGEPLPGPGAYWFSTGLTTGAFLLAIGVLTSRLTGWTGQTSALGVSQQGELATARDLKHLTVRHPRVGRLTLGRVGRKLIAAEPQTSLAVIGPTGCGKTAGFAIPAILEWNGPVVAISVKNDLLDATLQHRRSRGTTWIFDPTNISGHPSSTWSPLAGCTTWAGAQRTSTWLCQAAQARKDSVTDGDYWYSQARKGLSPYLHAGALGKKTIGDVVRWIDTQDSEEVEAILRAAGGVDTSLKELERSNEAHKLRRNFQPSIERRAIAIFRGEHELVDGGQDWVDKDPSDWPIERLRELQAKIGRELHEEVAAALLEEAVEALTPTGRLDPLISARSLWGKEPRLRGSIYATIENVLATYADPDVAKNTASNQIDIDEWLTGDNTIYIIATADEQERLRPVLNVLLQQAIRTAYETATRRGGSLALPTLVMLDEAGNIAPLRQLPTYAATARSHNISLVTIWQDLAQIRSIYHDQAQTVLNNHRAKLFGSGIADQDTLTYVSRLIGDQQRISQNRSGDLHTGRRSVSEHTTYRPTAPADIIRRVPQNHALLLYGRDLPAQVQFRPWYSSSLDRHTRTFR